MYVGELLPVAVLHDEAGIVVILDRPGRRKAAFWHGARCYFRPTARRIVAPLISAAWSFFFNQSTTSRQIDRRGRPFNDDTTILLQARRLLLSTHRIVGPGKGQSRMLLDGPSH